MKNIKRVFTLILSSAVVVLATLTMNACKQGKQQQQQQDEISLRDAGNEMEEAVDTTMAYLSEERKKKVEEYEKQLDQINDQIEDFKGEMGSASKSVKEEFRVQIDKLESTYADAQNDLDEFREASEDAWQELNEGLEKAFNELKEAIEAAREEFNRK